MLQGLKVSGAEVSPWASMVRHNAGCLKTGVST
jgi:hypothetical protein